MTVMRMAFTHMTPRGSIQAARVLGNGWSEAAMRLPAASPKRSAPRTIRVGFIVEPG
jgi:hypothetical protein